MMTTQGRRPDYLRSGVGLVRSRQKKKKKIEGISSKRAAGGGKRRRGEDARSRKVLSVVLKWGGGGGRPRWTRIQIKTIMEAERTGVIR